MRQAAALLLLKQTQGLGGGQSCGLQLIFALDAERELISRQAIFFNEARDGVTDQLEFAIDTGLILEQSGNLGGVANVEEE